MITTQDRQSPGKRPGKPPGRAPKPTRIRCFAGIRCSRLEMFQGLLPELDLLVDDPASRLRIVPPGNLHITLKFLGPVDQQQLGAIDVALQAVSRQHGPIELSYKGVGVFKNSIWVGVAHNDALTRLAGAIDGACGELGFKPEEKPYVPHVTLARFDRGAKIGLSALLQKFANRQWGSATVSSMRLFKSETLAEGARYSILSKYDLAGESSGS